MTKKLIMVLSFALLVGCAYKEQDKVIKKVESIVNVDWDEYVPLDDMIIAHKQCKEYSELDPCKKLESQLQDIATSLESCKSQIPRSTLCSAVINTISAHPIENILPETDAPSMPQHPFYLSLPTRLLDSQSRRYSYRKEVWDDWIQKYRFLFRKMILSTIIFLVALVWFKIYKKEKTNQAEMERRKIIREQKIAAQKMRDDEARKREAEAASKLIIEQAKNAEQKKLREIERAEIELQIAAEKLAAEEAAAREAAEKLMIEEMAKAAVKKSPKKK